MSKFRASAAQVLRRQQNCHRRVYSDHAHGAGNANADDVGSTLIPARLMRYLVKSNPKSTERMDPDKNPETLLKYHSIEDLYTRRLLAPDGTLLKTTPPTNLHKISNLEALQLWFEQYAVAGYTTSSDLDSFKIALGNCERLHSSQEILSVLYAFILRHKFRDMRVPEVIHIAGIYYASQCFLPSALNYHLEHLSAPLQEDDTDAIITSLLVASRTFRFADSKYDSGPMLAMVAGEGPHKMKFRRKLADVLQLRDGSFSTMIELLLELGSSTSLEPVWDSLIKRLLTSSHQPLIDDAYTCVMLFLKADLVDHAKVCLEELTEIMNVKRDFHPSLRVSSQLVTILENYGLNVPRGMRNRIRRAGDQLSNEGGNTGWAENLQMDEETINFSSVESLITQVQEYGNSRSVSDIGLVIDALNDSEGSPIPLFTQPLDDGIIRFAWFPQWNPVATQLESDPATSDSFTLGLLQARVEFRNILASPERCRNLFQLGHLAQQTLPSSSTNGSSEQIDAGEWEKTGYLVAFDRVSSDFLLVFVGDNPSLVGSPDHVQTWHFKQNPLLGSLSNLIMPNSSQDFDRDIEDATFPAQNAAPRYVFDIDPGRGLRP
ncbi:hypothetical protein BGW36DRAFT_355556 [Talaromyces proteolyticus]|uniref:Uncharacterized protein n=1 Tax=Talaromyces proteolyticus TaxID=1131652 RepID=A0AAD4Q5H4_9EURO|nr:uncharacterized protein BGW36DRAFT_355556 [Talaromyces proteolyticus]KAH8704181.1 hypothetical protein BGW36DRAFT_355556 [Talaromyces proteolyticus]